MPNGTPRLGHDNVQSLDGSGIGNSDDAGQLGRIRPAAAKSTPCYRHPDISVFGFRNTGNVGVEETLAEMVGTTRSRVKLFMNRFRKLGFGRYNGELEVHSSLLNVVLND
jgi:hypothetical protein